MISPGTLLQYDYNVNEIRLCLSGDCYLWVAYENFYFLKTDYLHLKWKTIL